MLLWHSMGNNGVMALDGDFNDSITVLVMEEEKEDDEANKKRLLVK